MRIVILGAGVIGVTSAYYLAKAGHQVTVLDRQPGPALETSLFWADEAEIVAKRLVDYLERHRFVVMQKPPIGGAAAIGREKADHAILSRGGQPGAGGAPGQAPDAAAVPRKKD